MIRIVSLVGSCALLVAGCAEDVYPGVGEWDLSVRVDGALPDLAVAPSADLTALPDLAGSDACVPNQGPGCCYPTCKLGEEIHCMGKNICGYPCVCEPVPGGDVPRVSADRPGITQNCQPSVEPDPVGITLSLGAYNGSYADIGPIHLGGGRVLDANGKTVLTFAFKPDADFIEPAMQQSVRFQIDKVPGSGVPKNGCNTLPCGKLATVVVDYGPPGVPPTRSVTSSETTIYCVF